MKSAGKLWAIVLAGGRGRRLKAFLRRRGHPHPVKQFCAIIGRQSMLQHTWRRAELAVRSARVLTVIDAAHAEMFGAQLASRAPGTLNAQPTNRETLARARRKRRASWRRDDDREGPRAGPLRFRTGRFRRN